jgi:hypothetical protein
MCEKCKQNDGEFILDPEEERRMQSFCADRSAEKKHLKGVKPLKKKR